MLSQERTTLAWTIKLFWLFWFVQRESGSEPPEHKQELEPEQRRSQLLLHTLKDKGREEHASWFSVINLKFGFEATSVLFYKHQRALKCSACICRLGADCGPRDNDWVRGWWWDFNIASKFSKSNYDPIVLVSFFVSFLESPSIHEHTSDSECHQDKSPQVNKEFPPLSKQSH